MSEVKRFCTDCGKPLEPGTRFCGNCGKPVSGGTPPAAAPAAPVYAAPPVQNVPGERLIGIIPGVSRKKGLFGVEGFSVVVTEKRIIFAAVTNEMIKEAAKKESEGKGFLAGMLGAATVEYTFHKRYYDMAPEAVLAENSQNFAVELSRIKKVKVEEGRRLPREKGAVIHHDRWEDGKFEVQTAGDKYVFTLPHSSYDAAVEVMRKAGLN